eukprot:PITA_18241
MEELSMVALSGCIWLQAFVITLETNSFTILQHAAIWGNLIAFYVINFIVSTIPWAGMYTIMFRVCKQPAYWLTMLAIIILGMGPITALKYFRYTYRSSAINILQQLERSQPNTHSNPNLEAPIKSMEKEVSPLSVTHPKSSKASVYEPLLCESPSTKRAAGVAAFDFLQANPSRLSFSYARSKNN